MIRIPARVRGQVEVTGGARQPQVESHQIHEAPTARYVHVCRVS